MGLWNDIDRNKIDKGCIFGYPMWDSENRRATFGTVCKSEMQSIGIKKTTVRCLKFQSGAVTIQLGDLERLFEKHYESSKIAYFHK